MADEKQAHMIRRQVLDLHLNEEEQAMSLQDQMSSIFSSELSPIIESVLDEFSHADEMIRFDRVEVDLGDIPPQQFVSEFKKRLILELRKALAIEIGKNHQEIDLFKIDAPQRIPIVQAKLDLLIHFLDYGYLSPWARGKDIELPILLEEFISHEPEALSLALRCMSNPLSGIRRLTEQFSEELQKELQEVLMPGHEAILEEVLKLLEKTFRDQVSGMFSTEQLRKEFAVVVFLYAVQHEVSYGGIDRESFGTILVEHIFQIFGFKESRQMIEVLTDPQSSFFPALSSPQLERIKTDWSKIVIPTSDDLVEEQEESSESSSDHEQAKPKTSSLPTTEHSPNSNLSIVPTSLDMEERIDPGVKDENILINPLSVEASFPLQAQIDVIIHSLINEEWPWWAPEQLKSEVPDQLLAKLLDKQSRLVSDQFLPSLSKQIRESSNQSSIIGRRISQTLSLATQISLIELIEPRFSGFLFLLNRFVKETLEADEQLIAVLWARVWTYYIDHPDTQTDLPTLLKRILPTIAAAQQLSTKQFYQKVSKLLQLQSQHGERRFLPIQPLIIELLQNEGETSDSYPVDSSTIPEESVGSEESRSTPSDSSNKKEISSGEEISQNPPINPSEPAQLTQEQQTPLEEKGQEERITTNEVVDGETILPPSDEGQPTEESDPISISPEHEDASSHIVTRTEKESEGEKKSLDDSHSEILSPEDRSHETRKDPNVEDRDTFKDEEREREESSKPEVPKAGRENKELEQKEEEIATDPIKDSPLLPSQELQQDHISKEDEVDEVVSEEMKNMSPFDPLNLDLKKEKGEAFEEMKQRLRMFSYFLRYGSFPSDATSPSQQTFEETILALSQEHPQPLAQLMSKMILVADIRNRIISQLSDRLFEALIQILPSVQGSDLVAHYRDMRLLAQTSIDILPQSLLKQELLAYVIAQSGRTPVPYQYLYKMFKRLRKQGVKVRTTVLLPLIKAVEGSSLVLKEELVEIFTVINQEFIQLEQAASTRPPVQPVPRSRPLGDLPIDIANAGLVLIWPFIPHYFKMLEFLTPTRKFKQIDDAKRAVHLLQYIVRKSTDEPEERLVLNKLMCGVPLTEPIEGSINITDREAELAENLLQAACGQWTAMKNATPDGLRGSFLIRNGKLDKKLKNWELKVEKKPYDMLIDRLPWSISMVKFPWMDSILQVEWR